MASRLLLLVLFNIALFCVADLPHRIHIDGDFGDWDPVPSYEDPDDNMAGTVLQDGIPDCHTTTETQKCAIPAHVYNPIVNLLEFKFTHDEHNLYAYLRAKANISLTAKGAHPGRSYIQVILDADNNQTTGYCLNLGGYYPTTCGNDLHFEIEMYNGSFNTAHYLLHSAWDNATYLIAYEQQKKGIVTFNGPAEYRPYTEWVYYDAKHPMSPDEVKRCRDGPHKLPNGGQICFVKDEVGGPFKGVMSYAFDRGDTMVEMAAPFEGFLNKLDGTPVIGMGTMLHFTMALETSGELQREGKWSTDASWQIRGYVLEPFPPHGGDGDGVSEDMVVLISLLSFGAGLVFTTILAALVIYVLFHKKQGYSVVN